MKRILLLLTLSAPALAFVVHLFTGAGASGIGNVGWFPTSPETTAQDGNPAVQNHAAPGEGPGSTEGAGIKPSDPQVQTAWVSAPPPGEQPSVSWEFGPGSPFEEYRLAQAITSAENEYSRAVPGLTGARAGGGRSYPLTGGRGAFTSVGGPSGGGGSSLPGGGSFPFDGDSEDVVREPTLPPPAHDPFVRPPEVVPTVNPAASIPEPGTLLLLASGLGGLLWVGRRLERQG